ncbi:uncharacterized protein [Euwallacea fornicatus]|uniref:uncharacterized protein n=1 Tax=Euwallacea fornicatus TaxID=995702 RepID=UPI00338F0A9F
MSPLYTTTNIQFLYPLFVLLSIPIVPECSMEIKNSGTGTVLFNPTDVTKSCWAQEEIAVLTARIIFEDLMPDPKRISVQCNKDIEDLVEYFKLVIDNVRIKANARKRHLLLLALTDLLGGFLHHAFLPMARKAFYAGAVDYVYMEKLIQLHEELKWFLRTSGQSWTKAMKVTKEVKVPIIDMEGLSIQKQTNGSCCERLIFYEYEPVRTQKCSVNLEKGVYFPLPFFDTRNRPTAIVLPLKRFALRNIESKRAAYVIMKFFISAEQCLKEKEVKPEMIQNFQNNLYTWIEEDVIPKLKDDKFYSAFGGIVRVQNTLKALGAKRENKPRVTYETEEDLGATPEAGCTFRKHRLLLITMLVIIIAWFLIGTCFICYRMKSNRLTFSEVRKGSESSSSFSSSKWSSVLSKPSLKTNQPLCKCCESSPSERSTFGFLSTSEYDSEKSRRKTRRGPKSQKSFSKKGSLCACAATDGPAVIDTKNSMKILPSIAEISENSIQREKKGSFRKISFRFNELSSDEDGACDPPRTQATNTKLSPALSGKIDSYSSSTIAKNESVEGIPSRSEGDVTNGRADCSEAFKFELTQSTTQEFTTSNMSSDTPLKNSKLSNNASTRGTSKRFSQQVDPTSQRDAALIKQIKVREERRLKDDSEGAEQRTYYDYHSPACHSSMTGSYDLYHRNEPNKPYIFGENFQTSTSSYLSEDEDE